MRHHRERLLAALLAVVLLVGWELLVRTGVVAALFFPAPTLIAATILAKIRSGELAPHLASTLTRTGVGLLVAAGVGLPLGWLAGLSSSARRFLDPWIAALHPIPKVALLPLLMVIVGVGDRAAILAVAAAAFFPIVLATIAGADEIPAACFEVARSCGAGRLRLLRRVLVPGSAPGALTGLRLGANVGFVVAIAVELVGEGRGLGSRIWLAWETFRIEDLWAYLTVISALGVGLASLIAWATRRLVPWRQETAEAERPATRPAVVGRAGRPPAAEATILRGGDR